MEKALEGIRVLEASSYIAAPTAALMLAEMGADVIKIEQTGVGDPYRGMTTVFGRDQSLPGGRTVGYDGSNRSKRGMTLNLRHERGLEVLHRLVRQSDVFITNFSKTQVEGMRIDYPALREQNPTLIYARLSAWGDEGPRAGSQGMDYLMQGPSGLMWTGGNAEDPTPSRIIGAVVDMTAATLLSMGILGALVARERAGIGQEVTTSLLGSGLHLQRSNVNRVLVLESGYPRSSRLEGQQPLGTFYRCADGGWIIFQNNRPEDVWPEFASTMGLDFGLDDRPAGEVIATLDELFAGKDRDHWLELFEGKRFRYAPVYTMDEAVRDPQVLANQYVVNEDHPTLGRIAVPGFPIAFSETPLAIQSSAPEFGQHTELILTDVCGYGWDEIEQLKDEGVID